MLKCRELAELVTPYLEDALPLRARLAARLHLFLCAACRRYVEQMRLTIRFLGSRSPPSSPESDNKIMELLEGSRRE